jgi:hypothetical protein
MARARRTNATISLFSFQDIITGVTAIVLLLTLLLLLELISRKATASLRASSTTASELIELTEAMAADPPPAVAFDGVPSAEAVRRLIDRRRRVTTREKETLSARLQEVRDRALASRTELGEAREAYAIEAARADTTAEFQQEAESLRRQLAELQTDRRELQRLLAQTEARAVMPSGPPKLQFRAADQTEAGSWLVVLGAAEIEAMPVSGGEPTGWTGTDAAAQFANWLSAGRGVPRLRHCVVLIRPSGISFYEAVRTAIETADIAIGTEAIGEHQQVAVPTSEGGA